MMFNKITKILKDSSDLKLNMIQACASEIERAIEMVLICLSKGGKILVFGNGGSAADSQHLAAEIVGRFYKDRSAMPAMALTTDTSILTSVGNDYGFERIFARQVEGLARPGDLLIGISTSGSSPNVVEAIRAGKEAGCTTVALTGAKTCALDELVDCVIKVPSDDTPRIQEGHGTIIHIIAQLTEQANFEESL